MSDAGPPVRILLPLLGRHSSSPSSLVAIDARRIGGLTRMRWAEAHVGTADDEFGEIVLMKEFDKTLRKALCVFASELLPVPVIVPCDDRLSAGGPAVESGCSVLVVWWSGRGEGA